MNQNGQIRYTCVSSFPYSPFASRSLAVSQPNLIPHWQHIPRFSAVVAGPSRSSPSGRRLWYGFLIRFFSTLAAYSVIRCHCGKRSCQVCCRCFCIVQHVVRVYSTYYQLFKSRQYAGPRAFCRKTAILSPVQQLLIFKVVGCQAFL